MAGVIANWHSLHNWVARLFSRPPTGCPGSDNHINNIIESDANTSLDLTTINNAISGVIRDISLLRPREINKAAIQNNTSFPIRKKVVVWILIFRIFLESWLYTTEYSGVYKFKHLIHMILILITRTLHTHHQTLSKPPEWSSLPLSPSFLSLPVPVLFPPYKSLLLLMSWLLAKALSNTTLWLPHPPFSTSAAKARPPPSVLLTSRKRVAAHLGIRPSSKTPTFW